MSATSSERIAIHDTLNGPKHAETSDMRRQSRRASGQKLDGTRDS